MKSFLALNCTREQQLFDLSQCYLLTAVSQIINFTDFFPMFRNLSRYVAVMVDFCLSENTLLTYLKQSEVLPTRPSPSNTTKREKADQNEDPGLQSPGTNSFPPSQTSPEPRHTFVSQLRHSFRCGNPRAVVLLQWRSARGGGALPRSLPRANFRVVCVYANKVRSGALRGKGV